MEGWVCIKSKTITPPSPPRNRGGENYAKKGVWWARSELTP